MNRVVIVIRYEADPYEEVVLGPKGMDLREAIETCDDLLRQYSPDLEKPDQEYDPTGWLVTHGFEVPAWGRSEEYI